MNADFKAIALKLGLPETAAEAEILARIGILQGHQTANMELRKQLDEIRLASVTPSRQESSMRTRGNTSSVWARQWERTP